MVSVASAGTAARIAARILFKALRAGSGTPARYSSTLLGAAERFAAAPRVSDLLLFLFIGQYYKGPETAGARAAREISGSSRIVTGHEPVGDTVPTLFHQVYNPVAGSVLASALVASLPPILLAVLLAVLRVAPWRAAIAGAAAAFGLAWLVWGMPLSLTIGAATHGMAYGLWPICWIVVTAVFFFNLSVESGDFEVIHRSLGRLTGDGRIQVLLVAFCFGALIEGITGFGAPVAITAAMLA